MTWVLLGAYSCRNQGSNLVIDVQGILILRWLDKEAKRMGLVVNEDKTKYLLSSNKSFRERDFAEDLFECPLNIGNGEYRRRWSYTPTLT